jgi:hypothetical protein
MPKSSLLAAAMQMMAGSVSLLGVGGVRGEWSSFEPTAGSVTARVGLGDLGICGSGVGVTAYSWLIKN